MSDAMNLESQYTATRREHSQRHHDQLTSRPITQARKTSPTLVKLIAYCKSDKKKNAKCALDADQRRLDKYEEVFQSTFEFHTETSFIPKREGKAPQVFLGQKFQKLHEEHEATGCASLVYMFLV